MSLQNAVRELPQLFPRDWWHSGGYKMRVAELDLEHRTLALEGSRGSHLYISRTKEDEWDVSWHLIHGHLIHESSGHVPMTDSMVRAAVGLPGGCHGDHALARRFGVDVAFQGAFVRTGNYLNIPCLGDGLDGNPNISIHLDADIRKAVEALLSKD